MKIAHNTAPPPVGGAEQAVLDLTGVLGPQGLELCLRSFSTRPQTTVPSAPASMTGSLLSLGLLSRPRGSSRAPSWKSTETPWRPDRDPNGRRGWRLRIRGRRNVSRSAVV